MITKAIINGSVSDPTGGSIRADITSIVMDKDEFDAFVDFFATLNVAGINYPGQNANNWSMMFKNSNVVPLVARGTKTQALFDKYEITTDYLAAIVRGEGKVILNKILAAENASNN